MTDHETTPAPRYSLPTPRVAAPEGYVQDAKGRLVPEQQVKGAEALEDQTVRIIMAYAVELANQIDRFYHHTQLDLQTFLLALADQYGASKRGAEGKGNVTLTSYDGLLKVQFAVADRLVFGPSLQVAKSLFDECVGEWSADARPELRAIIADAFQTDKEGSVNREAVLRLLRLEIDDLRWEQAQAAIRDAIRVIGTKRYVRFYSRERPDAPWQPIPIDLSAS
ncbi:DUF3164 family protein [Algihabitans albus]|uniref:DUF3164 family protein n=1 Tax=Algihabitans albus TaxID=2164067 RepID=UPI001ABC7553|nr:DUF3164 family protein [Algihabitans albus]